MDNYKGSYESLTEIWKIIDAIKIGEDEKKKIGWKVEGNTVIWSPDTPDLETEFTVDQLKVIKEIWESKSSKKELGVDAKVLQELYEKIRS